MPFENFSIGKDVVLNVNTPNGPLALPVTTTGFDAKAIYKTINSAPLNGENLEASLPAGWRGTITLDRRDNTIDSFFAAQEAGYYAGQNVLTASITETITEADGSRSQFLYTKVSLSFQDAGKKQGDAKIEQTIGFFASKRIQLS